MTCILIFLKRILLFPIAILFSSFGTFLFMVIYVLQFIPCILYRNFVFIVAKCVYPYARMLPGADNVIAGGSVYKTKELYNAVNMILEGKVDLEKLSLDLHTKVIDKRLPNGKLQFPELQCYIETFMGYSFYRKDKDFDLRNHIKLHTNTTNDVFDKIKYHKLRKEHISKIFPEKRSPWEVLVIHNYQNEKENNNGKEYSIVQFKVHHCLADGYATINALFSPFGKVAPLSIPKFGDTFASRLLFSISSLFHLFLISGEILFNLIYNPRKAFDLNSWQKLNSKSDTDAILWSPKPLQTDIVKEISRANKVSISSVLITACAGGFRRMMEAKGIKSPKNIRIGFTHHMPNPSNRLTNNSAGTFFRIPITESATTSREKLQQTNKNLNIALGVSFKFLSRLFAGIIRYFPGSFTCGPEVKKSFVTMGFTTVPLPSFDIEWAGCKLLEPYNNIEFIDISVAMIVNILKYRSHFFVTFAVQRTLLSSEKEIQEIEKYFYDEISYLKSNICNV